MSRTKKIISLLLSVTVCICALFVYEVNKEHHYAPKTAEIIIAENRINDSTFILQDGTVDFALADHITFVSDVENGTANLETTKKVFGFYECEINRVIDEYLPVVAYSVADETIATVTREGTVTALSKGRTSLTVTADEISVEIPFTVYKAVTTDRLKQDIVLLKGGREALVKRGDYEVPRARFHSSDENVATVDKTGAVTAVGKGKAEIYTYKNGTEKISTKVTVKQPVESLNMKSINVYAGQSVTLKATYAPQNADYGTKISYSSSDSSVATVSGNTLTGIKAGEAVITATSGNGITAQAKVIVTSPPQAKPTVTTISKAEFDSYGGEKYSDGSPYVSYFKISFDQPVASFRINYVTDNGNSIQTGSAIYNNASVPADSPLYFAVCVNTSDVVATRGFSFVNRDGSVKHFWLHFSGRDGSVTYSEYR